jgi:hypothetical protein
MRRRRTQRRVQGMLDPVLQVVPAVVDAEVGLPADDLALQGAADGEVVGLGVDQRQVAVGIDRQDVLAGVVGRPERGGGFRVATLAAAPGVGFPAVGQRLAGVEVDRGFLDVAVAEAGVEDVRRKARIHVAAVGGVLKLVAGRDRQEAVGAELEALPGLDGGRAAVGPVGVAGVEEVDVGVVLAVGDVRAAAVVGLAQADVDHAGYGVGAVDRRGAVAQHFDAVDGDLGDGVQVDGGRAAPHRAVQVDQRRGVGAHAIDQHQCLVGPLAAQHDRADGVGAVGVGRTREVD